MSPLGAQDGLQDLVKEYRFWVNEKNHPKLTTDEFHIWLFLRLKKVQVTPRELLVTLIQSKASS